MSRLNNWGKLKWTNTGFVSSLEILDLTITIDKNNKLHYKTYQKEHNMYLYIPPSSAHSPDMVWGLIYGRLRTYYKHNTDYEDYTLMATLLAERLLARGWKWTDIRPIFRDAHYGIVGNKTALNNNNNNKNKYNNNNNNNNKNSRNAKMRPIFIHMTYHPRGIQRSQLRQIYMETLGQEIENPLIIAVSHPKNIEDHICSSNFPPVEGYNPSDFIF